MKFLFALHHPGAFRSFEGVVRQLCGEGHRVKILHGHIEKSIDIDRGLKACQADLENFEFESMLMRKNWLLPVNVRELLNCINYLRPQHPNPWEAWRWKHNIIRPIRKAIKREKVVKLLAAEKTQKILKIIEHVIPPDPAIIRWLELNRPDVVVASPFIFELSNEVEYIKAARALKIPTVVVVLSWDNLTTKGTFHIIPDLTLVWNNALAKEATTLHDVPKNKIAITGAPTFDFWFEMGPSPNRTSFCNKIGIDPDRPFILYLCSSVYIAGDETSFVREFASVLSEHPDTRAASLVVRPHPLNATSWRSFQAANIAVWPKGGEWVDLQAAKQDYYNTIFHSLAVVGVNTSAFLEATILDKPCVTIMTEHYRSKQTGLSHFRHLLSGNFIETAHSFSEAASVLAAILAGKDSKKQQRQRFVREFIRPRGIDKSASKIMAKALEAAALRKNIDQILTP